MSPSIHETVSICLIDWRLVADFTPPRDPNDDDEEDEQDEENEDRQDEPAVIREPDDDE